MTWFFCSDVVTKLGLAHQHCESCHEDLDMGESICEEEDGDDLMITCCDVHRVLEEIGMPEVWRRLRASQGALAPPSPRIEAGKATSLEDAPGTADPEDAPLSG